MKKINYQLNSSEEDLANKTVANMKQSVIKSQEVQSFLVSNQSVLSSNPIEDNLNVLYEFVVQNDNNILYPGRKPHLVLNGNTIAVDYLEASPVNKTSSYQKIFGDFDSTNSIANLKTIETTKVRTIVLNELTDSLNQLLASNDDFVQGLFFYGEFGVGKSFLIGAISNALAEQKINNIIVHWPSFIKKLQGQFGQPQNINSQLLEQTKKTKVLLIDDLGADSLSVWSRDDILAPILEYRMANKKTTFFTSNFDFKHLESDYLTTTKDTHEPIKAGRLMQRIRFLSKEVLVSGENRRLN